ncbi:hypothetical protein RRG08_054355 [Elysia crispata]|uniref:ShKT domain-containing protein n=1 Tax=Elysia crispata TaxID=231223 RepID=A0AAE1EAU5_9GAST|nr:hypothetical protein RRG08_054355 [Elysia crispata]
MEKWIFLGLLIVILTNCSSTYDSLGPMQNISCADPPPDYGNDLKIDEPEFSMAEECRNWADCDPYGFSMCSEHKKWAKKCCALYCNFCH